MSKSEISKRIIRYIPGMPRDYRANCAGAAGFVLDTVTGSTEKTFDFQPIAYRFFSDVLFNDIKKGINRNWAELFFIDKDNCVSSIMFHGFSVENLKRTMSLLYYAGHDLHEVAIKASFTEHKNEAENSKYHIAEFNISDSQPESEVVVENLTWAKENKPYRGESITPQAKIEVAFNYPDFNIQDVQDDNSGGSKED